MLQEIDEMLSNNLSLDDEDAVQEELSQLQAEAVRVRHQSRTPVVLLTAAYFAGAGSTTWRTGRSSEGPYLRAYPRRTAGYVVIHR